MSVSRKQMDYTQKYIHENYEQISIRMKKGERDRYKRLAEKLGVSVNQLFLQAVEEFIAEHIAED